jgi:Sulfotransferase domain
MFKIENLKTKIAEKIETTLTNNYVKISAQDGSNDYYIVTKAFADRYLERIKNLEVYEDDVWVVTFPKCGTSWTQEMVWMINNNLNFEKALNIPDMERFPFLE